MKITKLKLAIVTFLFMLLILITIHFIDQVTYFDTNSGRLKKSYRIFNLEFDITTQETFVSDFYLKHVPEPQQPNWCTFSSEPVNPLISMCVYTYALHNFSELRTLNVYTEYMKQDGQPFPLEKKLDLVKKVLQATNDQKLVSFEFNLDEHQITLKID
ncbi:hypothetical protein JD969_11595 [Planctomycetota bacterium]|nr:hypothetical protein JD969_11595 [Planctomycetota bacterium]